MKILDLFSGIGGFSLALERLGNETIAFCEIDNYASKVLEKRWPNVPNFKHGIIGLNSLLTRVLKSSPLGSPVRISHSLDAAPDLPAPAQDSFGHSCEPFAWFDPKSRTWRTWQRCLIEGWEVFSGTWPRSGMTRNGIAYRRQPLVRLTNGTGPGSNLPTPRPCSGKRSSGLNRSEMMEALKTWPTPTARDWKDGSADACKNVPVNGLLGRAVHQWPTPRATPAMARGEMGRPDRARLEDVIANTEQANGTLNPAWVEWLMGYPIGWTDLNVAGTASSLKSRSIFMDEKT